MTFEELAAKLLQLKCEEKRFEERNYVEAVFSTEELKKVFAVLDSFFGPPIKPQGKPPSAEAAKLAKPHGGVFDNQTLYYKTGPTTSELALLWPWGNGTSTTLKLIRRPA